jgi:hypothetical protein
MLGFTFPDYIHLKIAEERYVMMDLQPLHAYLLYSIRQRYSTQAGEYHVSAFLKTSFTSVGSLYSTVPPILSSNLVFMASFVSLSLCSTQPHTYSGIYASLIPTSMYIMM